MALNVPNRWDHGRLESARVKQPVAHGPFQAFVTQGAFLLGRAKALIGSVAGLPQSNGDVSFEYVKAPGDAAVLIRVLLHAGGGTADRATVNARILNAAGSVVGAELTGTGTSPLDGATSIECARTDVRLPAGYEKYWNVTALTVGTRYEIRVTTANSSGTATGIYSLSAYVVPRDALDPANNPTTDPGVSEPFVLPRNPVFAGSADTAGDVGQGTERIVKTLDQARTAACRYMQIATVQTGVVTTSWIVTNTAFADPAWGFSGAATTPRWTTRSRRLYATTVANTLLAVVRYRTTGGANNLTVRFTRASDSATYDVACAGTAGAVFTTATAAVSFATSGTDQEESWTVTAKMSAGSGYIATVALIDNES